MSNLPVVHEGDSLAIVDANGELVPLTDATDRAILDAYERVAEADREVFAAKRALAAELRVRYGVGSTNAAGFAFKITESQSWPQGRTKEALSDLLGQGKIQQADVERAMPMKRVPDARALKALVGRLTVEDPVAAKLLADACSVSAPSLRDVQEDAVRGEVV
jgi:hypothetical protein